MKIEIIKLRHNRYMVKVDGAIRFRYVHARSEAEALAMVLPTATAARLLEVL